VSKWTGQLGHGCTHHEASSKGVSHRRSSSYCTWPRSWPRCADVWNKAPPQLQAAHNYEQHSAPRLSCEARRGSVPPAELRVAVGGREIVCTKRAVRAVPQVTCPVSQAPQNDRIAWTPESGSTTMYHHVDPICGGMPIWERQPTKRTSLPQNAYTQRATASTTLHPDRSCQRKQEPPPCRGIPANPTRKVSATVVHRPAHGSSRRQDGTRGRWCSYRYEPWRYWRGVGLRIRFGACCGNVARGAHVSCPTFAPGLP